VSKSCSASKTFDDHKPNDEFRRRVEEIKRGMLGFAREAVFTSAGSGPAPREPAMPSRVRVRIYARKEGSDAKFLKMAS
jgi:hypothetical protein